MSCPFLRLSPVRTSSIDTFRSPGPSQRVKAEGPMLTGGKVPGEALGARPSQRELLGRYSAYRRRHARGLLRLVPRDAIRPLYRAALSASLDGSDAVDPMEALVAYCEDLLPLPPFDVWLQDLGLNPEAHLYDVDDSPDAPSAETPVTVESRRFTYQDRGWVAHVRSFRDGATWRGFIAFEDELSRRVHRTALIFCESDPVDVCERFMAFEASALVAFLRSALP